ncbi:MAG: hypothetical protein R6V32_11595 [Bacteroidales bacterium]
MKQAITLIAVLFSLNVYSQVDTVHIHYFEDGAVSTIITMEDMRGEALAYDSERKVIYRKIVRKVAGTASVNFMHYSDGSVKTAKYYEAPDGGIQWYSQFLRFDKDGNVIEEREDGRDGIFDFW